MMHGRGLWVGVPLEISIGMGLDILQRTLTPFQRQANHSNFRIIDSPWHALFCVDHDHFRWRAKVFSSHYKAYFGKIFHIFIIQNK